MTRLSYEASLDFLFNLEKSGIKLGLERTVALLAASGDPQRSFSSVHIAGTNGKGSVACFLNSVVHHAGIPTGLFTSPHLVEYRERIRTGGRAMTRSDLIRLVAGLRPAIQKTGASYFEATTALAFEHFRRKRMDVAVVEVGMGGRLDSTNVLEPLVSCITSIDYDHTRYLGRTLSKIAAEKAGIVKPGIPVVCGALPRQASATIRRIAHSRGSRVLEVGKDARFEVLETGLDGSVFDYVGPQGRRRLAVASPGLHQVANAATALLTIETLRDRGLDVSDAAVRKGIRLAFWPGRFHVIRRRPLTVLDAAHNASGARALARTMKELELKSDVTVFGVLRDKDSKTMLRALAPVSGSFILTRPESDRALPLYKLKDAAKSLGIAARRTASVPRALEMARRECGRNGVMLVCGSLYMIGEAMEHLGFKPQRVSVC